MPIVIVFSLLLYVLLGMVAYISASRKNTLFWTDIISPIIVTILWIAFVAVGYGHQSSSQIIEFPMVLLCTLILLYFRVFILDKYTNNYKYNSYLVLGLSLLVVFLFRTFMSDKMVM